MIPRIAAEFAPLFSSVNKTMIALLLLFLVVAALISVFMSHSIAGPIFRFEKTLKAIGEGNLSLHIGLRKTDEFREMAGIINDMASSLRNKINIQNQLIGQLQDVCHRFELQDKYQQKKMPPTLTRDLQAIQEAVRQLQEQAAQFKI